MHNINNTTYSIIMLTSSLHLCSGMRTAQLQRRTGVQSEPLMGTSQTVLKPERGKARESEDIDGWCSPTVSAAVRKDGDGGTTHTTHTHIYMYTPWSIYINTSMCALVRFNFKLTCRVNSDAVRVQCRHPDAYPPIAIEISNEACVAAFLGTFALQIAAMESSAKANGVGGKLK